MAALLTAVSPGYGRVATVAEVVNLMGTGGVAGDKVWVRARGETTWINVDAAKITAWATDRWLMAVANPIASGGGVNWSGGLWDVGICASAGSTPTTILEDALYFYATDVFDGDKTVAGPPLAVYIGGVGVGHLDGSTDVEGTIETLKRYVNEVPGPVKIYKTGESKSLKLLLAEFTLENIALAWGLTSAITTPVTGKRVQTFGGETILAEKSVMLVLPGPSSKMLALTMYKCVVTAPGTISAAKGAGTVIPVTLDVLTDSTRPVGDQVGRYEEYTA